MSKVESALYLCKDNDDFISWCTCTDAPMSFPGQASCPWCGCGWLFSCFNCRHTFTFAKAVKVDISIAELIRQDAERFCKGTGFSFSEAGICERIDLMQEDLQDIEEGRQYVYFDGLYIPTDAPCVVDEGQHRSHDLDFVPQVKALLDASVETDILSSVDYWGVEDSSGY